MPGTGTARRRAVVTSQPARQRHARAGQGIGEAVGAVDQQAGAAVLRPDFGVQGQLARSENTGVPSGFGCDQDQRGVWMPGFAVEGGQRRLQRRAHQARGRLRDGRIVTLALPGLAWQALSTDIPGSIGFGVCLSGHSANNRALNPQTVPQFTHGGAIKRRIRGPTRSRGCQGHEREEYDRSRR